MSIPDTAPTIAHSVITMLAEQTPRVARVGSAMACIAAKLVTEPADQPALLVAVRPFIPDDPSDLHIEIVLTVHSIIASTPGPGPNSEHRGLPASGTMASDPLSPTGR